MRKSAIRRLIESIPWSPVLAAVLTLGIALPATWYAFVSTQDTIFQALLADFREQAAERSGLLHLELARSIESIESFADALQTEPLRVENRFQVLGPMLLDRHPELYSVAWSEWVSHDRREELVQSIAADGFELEDIFARDAEGRSYPAPEASHYLVLRQLFPAALASRAVGFDVMSEDDRRAIVQRAVNDAQVQATGPLQLGSDPNGLPGVLIFAPVYDSAAVADADVTDDVDARRDALLGTASIAFQITPSLTVWLERHASQLVQTLIFDADEQPAPRALFQHGFEAPLTQADIALLRQHPLAYQQEVDFAGRNWWILNVPAGHFEELLEAAVRPKLVLGFGVALSLLLAALVAVLVRRHVEMGRYAQERAQAAERLARANDELHLRNQDMEQFIAAVAHDLRSPLMAIRSLLHMAGAQLGESRYDAVRRSVDAASRSGSTMDRIISGLVEHARAGYAPVHGSDVDLDALVRSLIADYTDDVAARDAGVHIAGRLPTVFGDRSRLAAIFDNLLGNALRYGQPTRHGERLDIVIGCMSADESGRSVDDEPTHWAIYVRDNGPGIPPPERERIFQIFQRIDNGAEKAGSGTGIGLAVVQRAAVAHGGRAWVEASPGGGATFWVTIARNLRQQLASMHVPDSSPPDRN